MIEINNLTTSSIDKSFIKKVAEEVIKGEDKEGADLSIAIVESEEIKKVNNSYRGKNEVTNVLSFSESDVSSDYPEIRNNHLGEVLVCLERVKKDAREQEIDQEKELAKVLIHGILHLLGYDHERSEEEAKKMEDKQNYYLSNIN